MRTNPATALLDCLQRSVETVSGVWFFVLLFLKRVAPQRRADKSSLMSKNMGWFEVGVVRDNVKERVLVARFRLGGGAKGVVLLCSQSARSAGAREGARNGGRYAARKGCPKISGRVLEESAHAQNLISLKKWGNLVVTFSGRLWAP